MKRIFLLMALFASVVTSQIWAGGVPQGGAVTPGAAVLSFLPMFIIAIVIFVFILKEYKKIGDNEDKNVMLKLASRLFYRVYNLVLWLVVIGLTVGGAVLGSSIGIFGFIMVGFIGLVVGLILIIITGGLVTTFLDIGKSIRNMEKYMENIESSEDHNESG